LKSNRSDEDDGGTAKAAPYGAAPHGAAPDGAAPDGAAPHGAARYESPPHEVPRELADALTRARPRLGPLASRLLYFPTVGSTNDIALSRVASSRSAKASAERSSSSERAEGLVVVADQQTAGRGRRGHTWFSPAGSGLYVSVVLAPARARVDPERATLLLTLTAGVALAEAVEAVTGLHVDLKWPNDLYIARRKLAGILAESSGSSAPGESVVVGYGINVSSTAFPPELGERATSLESEFGRAVDRRELLVETLVSIARWYQDLLEGQFDAILDAWRRRAPAASGARVTWITTAGPQSGVTAGIDDRGALLVQAGDRVERIIAGEVTWPTP
jgi:BirA family transcriptional regulator, biotin operon repressor / biotin---[acetyl-CoA-carboxylase] ligase